VYFLQPYRPVDVERRRLVQKIFVDRSCNGRLDYRRNVALDGISEPVHQTERPYLEVGFL
jgi:hypothetical protein